MFVQQAKPNGRSKLLSKPKQASGTRQRCWWQQHRAVFLQTYIHRVKSGLSNHSIAAIIIAGKGMQ